jgi:hypothetical protein
MYLKLRETKVICLIEPNFVQIPDIRTGDDVIDGVVVDEDSIELGSDGLVRGAKILYGKGALDRYLSKEKNDSEVCIICNDLNVVFLLLSN